MGGISVLILLAVMSSIAFVIVAALALFVAATVISIVFAARTKQRHAQGKKLGPLIAIPISFYAFSIPVLILLGALVLVPAYSSSITTTYQDCSQAIVSHDPEELELCLSAPDLDLADEGPTSYRTLLYIALVYGDEECAGAILTKAKTTDRPIDLNKPLIKYNSDNNPKSSDYALNLATSTSFSSLDMMQMLIDFGADTNSADDAGNTPLHNACQDNCTTALASDTSSASLSETDAAIDLLLSEGANIQIENQLGKTPWDCYVQTMKRYVDDGVLTQAEATVHLDERAKTLKPSE